MPSVLGSGSGSDQKYWIAIGVLAVLVIALAVVVMRLWMKNRELQTPKSTAKATGE
jgi:flagellar basal body-associated protein FliL